MSDRIIPKPELAPKYWNDSERTALMNFWVDRYESAPTMRAPDGWGKGRLLGVSAGGEGLVIAGRHPQAESDMDPRDPGHPVVKARLAREEKLASEYRYAQGPDKERLMRLRTVESHAFDAWEAKTLREQADSPQEKGLRYRQQRKAETAQAQAMGELLHYDRIHRHPVADRKRDLQEDPPSPGETKSWLERGGRKASSEEREALHAVGADFSNVELESRQRQSQLNQSHPNLARGQAWYVDDATQRKVSEREGVERTELRVQTQEENEARKIDAPMGDQSRHLELAGSESMTPGQKRVAVSAKQLEYIDGPVNETRDSLSIHREGVREAARIDPEFASGLQKALGDGQGKEFFNNHMERVHAREKSVRTKVGLDDESMLPLRSSDVVLLRTEALAYGRAAAGVTDDAAPQVATAPVALEPSTLAQEAKAGAASGMNRTTLQSFDKDLTTLRAERAQGREQTSVEASTKTPEVSQPSAKPAAANATVLAPASQEAQESAEQKQQRIARELASTQAHNQTLEVKIGAEKVTQQQLERRALDLRRAQDRQKPESQPKREIDRYYNLERKEAYEPKPLERFRSSQQRIAAPRQDQQEREGLTAEHVLGFARERAQAFKQRAASFYDRTQDRGRELMGRNAHRQATAPQRDATASRRRQEFAQASERAKSNQQSHEQGWRVSDYRPSTDQATETNLQESLRPAAQAAPAQAQTISLRESRAMRPDPKVLLGQQAPALTESRQQGPTVEGVSNGSSHLSNLASSTQTRDISLRESRERRPDPKVLLGQSAPKAQGQGQSKSATDQTEKGAEPSQTRTISLRESRAMRPDPKVLTAGRPAGLPNGRDVGVGLGR